MPSLLGSGILYALSPRVCQCACPKRLRPSLDRRVEGGYATATVESIPEPEQQGIGRKFALPLAVTSILITAANGGLGLLVQLFLKEQGASTFLISLPASLNAAGALLGSMFWGSAADRNRRKPLLFITTIGVSAGVLLLTFLPSAQVVLASSLIRTFMRTGLVAISMAVISAASAEARRGRNLSYVSASSSLGFALGSLGAGYVLETLGFRWSFVLMTIVPLLGMLPLLVLPSEVKPAQRPQKAAWRVALSAGLTDLYVGTMLRQMAIHGSFSLLFVYMATLGIAPRHMGAVAALNTGTQVLGMLVFGRLADRIGRRRIFMLGFALSAVVPIVFVLATDTLGMAMAYITLGLSFSSLYIGSTAHIGDRVPKDRQGAMMGLYEMSRGGGGILGPILAGVLVPLIGYHGMFLTMAGIACLGFLVMLLRRSASGRRPGVALKGGGCR